MSQHPNSWLTPRGRETMVARVEASEPVSEVARQMGVSRQTASKWVGRARRGEPMSDRPCRPRRLARLTPPEDEARVAYAELLSDERGGTCSAFVASAIAFFASHGVVVERVMTDNGPDYRSRELNALLGARGVRHVYTRPFGPWQNGKVERMNQTLAREWQYARA